MVAVGAYGELSGRCAIEDSVLLCVSLDRAGGGAGGVGCHATRGEICSKGMRAWAPSVRRPSCTTQATGGSAAICRRTSAVSKRPRGVRPAQFLEGGLCFPCIAEHGVRPASGTHQ